MRTVGTNEDVIRAFVGTESEFYRNGKSSIWRTDNRLFSYNLPIASRAGNLVVVNGDKFSVTTNRHISNLQFSLRRRGVPHFTTSFSALSRVVFPASEGRVAEMLEEGSLEVVDWTEDFTASYDEGAWDKPLPSGVTIHRYSDGTPRQAHRSASALFRYRDKDCLAGMDENQFFISILPHQVFSLDEAYETLKPEDVKMAERQGLAVSRQGEWFFIPLHDGAEAREIYNRFPGPVGMRGVNGGNPHRVTRGEPLREGAYLASGRVHHLEHKTLVLSDCKNPEIYLAVENTARASYSSFGRVD